MIRRPSARGRGNLDASFDRRNLSQRRRLAVGALLSVVALAVLAGFLAWRQYDTGKEHALNEVRARVVLASTVFDTYFGGELSTLESIAKAPAVTKQDIPAMTAYFRRVQPPKGKLFPGGLGWIDLTGSERAMSSSPRPEPPDRGLRPATTSSGPSPPGGRSSARVSSRDGSTGGSS